MRLAFSYVGVFREQIEQEETLWGYAGSNQMKEECLTIRAKKINTPKLLANIQMTEQNSPARNLHVPAIFIRPAASLK
jgi:hypothetical protein